VSLCVEKATSELIPAAQEDLALNLEITDIIKSKRVNPKDSLRLILSRLTHENPNVQLLTLGLFDKCVRNAGKAFLVEMAGREFVDVAVSMMDDEYEYGQVLKKRIITNNLYKYKIIIIL
jgi:hepatocyte growth factor-regulated tyrosine kinase substrate